MQTEEMRLDGNAAGGVLREIFARDVTAALARCGGCGATDRSVRYSNTVTRWVSFFAARRVTPLCCESPARPGGLASTPSGFHS